MLTLVSTVPVAYSIWDGTPTPMASGCPTRPTRSRTASSSPSRSAAVLPRTVGRSIESRTETPSTAATATLVPPTSTPRTTTRNAIGRVTCGTRGALREFDVAGSGRIAP